MLDSKAITKIQSIVLIAIIVVAAVAGIIAYMVWSGPEQSSETIKIGVLADLDAVVGKEVWRGAVLAVEQINAEGGLLGKQVEVIGEDDDGGIDAILTTNALNRLITYDKVDFIIGYASGEAAFICQGIIAEHKKIFINYAGPCPDALIQRVLDDYSTYKYYFSTSFNMSATFEGITDNLVVFKENTGFRKIGYLGEDLPWANGIMEGLDNFLPANDFEIVYRGSFPLGTVDFSSYFAQAEAAEVEVLVPISSGSNGIAFIKEYYDRQSPMIVYDGVLGAAQSLESWDSTDGKCEHISVSMHPIDAAYPLTTKTIELRETYFERWGELTSGACSLGYDSVRFILADAIERAGTIDTDAVIETLEETSVETSNARNYVFTESHCTMVGEDPNGPDYDYPIVMIFQWQDGELVPVYPKKIMDEANATYMFPDWPGPWDNLD